MDALLTRRGGNGGNFGYSSIVDYPEIVDDTAVQLADLPYGFGSVGGAVSYKDKIHIMGGSGTEFNSLSAHHVWNGEAWTRLGDLPYQFYNSGNQAAIVYNDEIHIVGGMGNYYAHYKYNGETWIQLDNLPCKFDNSCLVNFNGKLHIIGGSGLIDGVNKAILHYVWDGIIWTQLSNLPYNIQKATAVSYDGNIYVLGCASSSYSTHNLIVNEDGTWEEGTALPASTYEASSVVYNNKIHLIGGVHGGDGYSAYYHYVLEDSTWKALPSLSKAFYGGYAVIYEGKIHILGGTAQAMNKLHYIIYSVSKSTDIRLPEKAELYSKGEVEKIQYVYEDDTAVKLGDLPYEFVRGGATVYNDEIHIMGSGVGGDSTLAHYKWDGEIWAQLNNLPISFCDGGIITYNGNIHLFGGGSALATQRRHYKWNGEVWTKLNDSVYGLNSSPVVVYKGHIYIVGNGANGQYKLEKWDEEADTWTEEGLAAYRATGHGAVSLNGFIYMFGGSYQNTTEYKRFCRYNGETWTELENLPYNFLSGDYTVYKNKLFLFGTTYGNDSYKSAVYDGNEWKSLKDIPYYAAQGAAISYKDKIHLLGGASPYTQHYTVYSEITANFPDESFSITPTEIQTPISTQFDKTVIPTDGIYRLIQYAGEYAFLALLKQSILQQRFLDAWYSYYKKGMEVNGEIIEEDGWQKPETNSKVLMIGKGWEE